MDEADEDSLRFPEGRDVLPLAIGLGWWPRIKARRFGFLVFRVTMRRFFRSPPNSEVSDFSTLGLFGAGEGWCSSFSGRGRLAEEAEEGSGGREDFEADEDETLGWRETETTGDATIVSLSGGGLDIGRWGVEILWVLILIDEVLGRGIGRLGSGATTGAGGGAGTGAGGGG